MSILNYSTSEKLSWEQRTSSISSILRFMMRGTSAKSTEPLATGDVPASGELGGGGGAWGTSTTSAGCMCGVCIVVLLNQSKQLEASPQC